VVNLRSDQSQPFGSVATLLGNIGNAGITHVAVATANAEPRN
jgi:biopolymer transport protein ExbD